jgi:hypothetical protein
MLARVTTALDDRVDEEPWGGRAAASGAGRVGVDATQPAVLLQEGQGRVQVGGLGEPAAFRC